MQMGGFFAAEETGAQIDFDRFAAALSWGGARAVQRKSLGSVALYGGETSAGPEEGPDLSVSLAGPFAGGQASGAAGNRLARLTAQYDADEAHLDLLRAPFGAPALYYVERPEGLLFATTPSALLASGFAEPRVEPQSAAELLQLQFTTGRGTLFEGIARLRPGERLRVRGGRIVERDRPERMDWLGDAPIPAWKAEGVLERGLAAALEAQWQGGGTPAMLYAGDTAATALLVFARRLGLPLGPIVLVDTVNGGAVSPRARDLEMRLGRLGLDHSVLAIGAEAFWAALPRAVSLLDDPVADYGAVPLLLGLESLGGDAQALVSSIGASEALAGHGRYRKLTRPALLGGRRMRARGFLEGLDVLKSETGDWRDGVAAALSRLESDTQSPLRAAQALDCGDFLHNDIVSVHHRLLSAAGVGLVAPMLAPGLARLGLALPDEAKIKSGRGQYALRNWLEAAFPEAEPFGLDHRLRLPIGRWLAEAAPRLAAPVARAAGVAAFCDPAAVERLFRNLGPGKRRGVGAAWQLVFFALWHRIHIEGHRPDGDTFAVLSDGA